MLQRKKRAVILLSGGLDSTTVLAIAQKEGYNIFGMSFFYGQKHSIELDYAKYNAQKYSATEHVIININPNIFSSSSLTNAQKNIPNRDVSVSEIPSTYVPARNLLMLSYAIAYAENNNCDSVFIGVNAIDYSGYPDCRPEFIKSFEKTANLATKCGVEGKNIQIKAPLQNLTKRDIIILGNKLNVDYTKTVSCYNANEAGVPCNICDSCKIRNAAFLEIESESSC